MQSSHESKLDKQLNHTAKQIGLSLDKQLEDADLDPVGLSPKRNELYVEHFDSLIQRFYDDDDTSDIANLLSRIKDELSMTANSYRKLYESSVTFGLQKALTARHENEDLRTENKALQLENTSLKDRIDYLSRKLSILECKNPNRRSDRQADKYKLELKRLKECNEEMKHHVEKCLVHGHREVYNQVMR